MTGDWSVEPITKVQADAIVSARHYSRRPSVFWAAYGLIINGMIEGVCVYGQPSPQTSRHAFKDRDYRLYELSRLVVQTGARNAASFLVGRSLRMLNRPSAVISFADSAWGHVGAIYQATNWIYTGATVSHDRMYLVDGERLHPLALRTRGITKPAQWAKENGIETIKPRPKHRYFFLNGGRREVREMRANMAYAEMPYPKGGGDRYDDGAHVEMRLRELGLFDFQFARIAMDIEDAHRDL